MTQELKQETLAFFKKYGYKFLGMKTQNNGQIVLLLSPVSSSLHKIVSSYKTVSMTTLLTYLYFNKFKNKKIDKFPKNVINLKVEIVHA